MGKRLRLEDQRDQQQHARPQPGTEVKIAVDLSRSKWVYCVRWQGAERLRLSTGGELKHLQALVRRYEECRVHLAFEACGFGYELAWWAQHEQIAVTVIAPSQMERPPGLQVKTDRLDVGRMARQLEDGSLKGIYVPGRAGHERRQVVRTYGQAVKERKRAQVRLRSLLQEHGRIGPTPRAGWKAYREWLGTQTLPQRVQLGPHAPAGAHREVWPGQSARGDAAVRVGQCAPRRRCDLACRLRSAGPAHRQEAGDHCRDAPTRGAAARALAGSVGGRQGRSGVDEAARRSAQRRRRLFPDRERLRNAGWSPPRGGTSGSFAALAFPGHGAPAGATNDNLVTVPPGTRTNNRLAITVLVCALRPARDQPREVVLEVRLRAVRWLPSTAQACWHELRLLEGVRSQSDLTRTAITARINRRVGELP